MKVKVKDLREGDVALINGKQKLLNILGWERIEKGSLIYCRVYDMETLKLSKDDYVDIVTESTIRCSNSKVLGLLKGSITRCVSIEVLDIKSVDTRMDYVIKLKNAKDKITGEIHFFKVSHSNLYYIHWMLPVQSNVYDVTVNKELHDDLLDRIQKKINDLTKLWGKL